MEYVRLGKTDLLISRVAFGAMKLTEAGGDENVALLVRKAYEAGLTLFDTSRKTPESEKLLGDALYDIRRNVFLSTTTAAKTSDEIPYALLAELCEIDGQKLVYEDILELDLEDVITLQAEISGKLQGTKTTQTAEKQ